ncbi:MAG: vWA domain-containing protein [Anaerolineae bacterium]|nr:VWA domain-containing protein [Ardenticatenia bacterium]MBK8540027.1 VWA domain-containing protein [Ardenticatenia bacterium]HQZ70121.1 VWA domain-containing protein [Anaerolineae bacterium]
MKDWKRRLAVAMAPVALIALAMSALASPALHAQTAPPALPASTCVAGLNKTVDPGQIEMGDTARVTMVITNTCPDEKRPVDLVFLVDTSLSMTRAENKTGADIATPDPNVTPGAGIGDPPPPPPPAPVQPLLALGLTSPDQGIGDPPPDPGAGGSVGGGKPGAEPSGCEGSDAVAPDPGIGGKATATPPGPGAPPTATPSSGIGGGGGVPGPGIGDDKTDPNPELAGTEDLIRETQKWLRKFVDQPEVKADLASGKMRLGLVGFNERGRRLVSLTNDSRSFVGRLGLLRGEGKTRIDVGLRSAERVFLENVRGQVKRDTNRVKVIVVISDGQFCSKDVNRARVDKTIRVVSVAAGRGANQKKLRQIASDQSFFFLLRDGEIKQILKLFADSRINPAIAVFDKVSWTSLTVRDTLSDTMELVAGSVNPAPSSITGRTMEWVLPNPGSPVTLTFDVRPLQAGQLPISASSRAEWSDSQKRAGSGDFPAVQLDVSPPR